MTDNAVWLLWLISLLLAGCASRPRTVEGTIVPAIGFDRAGVRYEIAAIKIESKVHWPGFERFIIERGVVVIVDRQHRVVPFDKMPDKASRKWRGRLMRVVQLSPDGTDIIGGEWEIGTRRQEYELPTLAFVIDSVPDN